MDGIQEPMKPLKLVAECLTCIHFSGKIYCFHKSSEAKLSCVLLNQLALLYLVFINGPSTFISLFGLTYFHLLAIIIGDSQERER